MLGSHLKLLCTALSNEQCTYLACVIADLPMHSRPAITEEPYNQAKQRSKGRPHPHCRRG